MNQTVTDLRAFVKAIESNANYLVGKADLFNVTSTITPLRKEESDSQPYLYTARFISRVHGQNPHDLAYRIRSEEKASDYDEHELLIEHVVALRTEIDKLNPKLNYEFDTNAGRLKVFVPEFNYREMGKPVSVAEGIPLFAQMRAALK